MLYEVCVPLKLIDSELYIGEALPDQHFITENWHFVDWIVLELLLCYHVKSRMLFFETLRNYLQWIPKPAHISIFNWRSITVNFPFIHHFYCIFISISKHRRITDDCMSIIKLFNTAHFAYNDRLPQWLHISPHQSF